MTWVLRHRRCKMLVYYQDFGAASSYRIQNYPASLGVLSDAASTPGLPAPSRRPRRRLPPPATGRAGAR